jgi:hypothetical protein
MPYRLLANNILYTVTEATIVHLTYILASRPSNGVRLQFSIFIYTFIKKKSTRKAVWRCDWSKIQGGGLTTLQQSKPYTTQIHK